MGQTKACLKDALAKARHWEEASLFSWPPHCCRTASGLKLRQSQWRRILRGQECVPHQLCTQHLLSVHLFSPMSVRDQLPAAAPAPACPTTPRALVTPGPGKFWTHLSIAASRSAFVHMTPTPISGPGSKLTVWLHALDPEARADLGTPIHFTLLRPRRAAGGGPHAALPSVVGRMEA